MAAAIHGHGTRCRWVVSVMAQPFYHQRKTRCRSLKRMLWGFHSYAGYSSPQPSHYTKFVPVPQHSKNPFIITYSQHFATYSTEKYEEWNGSRRHVSHIRSKGIQGGSNMTRTDLCVNKPHCAAAVRPWESEVTTSTLPPAWVRTCSVLSGSC